MTELASQQSSLEELISQNGLHGALQVLLKPNEWRIHERKLSNGFEIGAERTRIIDSVVMYFFKRIMEPQEEQNLVFGAVGAHGKRELMPNSDVDLVLIYDRRTPAIDHYERISKTDFFHASSYLTGTVLVNSVDEIPQFEVDKFTSMLDFRLLAGSPELGYKVKQHLRQYSDPQEIVSYILKRLEKMQKEFPQEISNVKSFNVKYGIGCLRHFHTGVWIEAIKNLSSSHDIYKGLPKDVLESVNLLLKTRSWLNIRKNFGPTMKENDELTYDDLRQFIDYFGPESFRMLMEARRRIHHFTEAITYKRLKRGISIPGGLEQGIGGIRISPANLEDQSDIFYRVMLQSQRRDLPIELDLYHRYLSEACNFVKPSPAFLDFFSEKGSLPATIKRLIKFNVMGNIMPGFSYLETALFESGHRNKYITRAGQARHRLENLENLADINVQIDPQTEFFRKEHSLLQPEQLQALKLALFCKGIPESMGITTRTYAAKLSRVYPQISDQMLKTIKFLINKRGLLFDTAQQHVVDDSATFSHLRKRVQDAERLRMLLLFTYADLGYGKHEQFSPEQWGNVLDLYRNTMKKITGQKSMAYDPFALDEERKAIAEHLPENFLHSRYANKLITYVNRLLKVNVQKNPSISFNRTYSDKTAFLEIASEDFAGLLWRIAGTCYMHGIDIKQAQIYSLNNPYKLALDLFSVTLNNGLNESEFKKDLEKIIIEKGQIDIPASEVLERANLTSVDIEAFPKRGDYRMTVSGDDQIGLFYAITRTLSEQVGADIRATNGNKSMDGKVGNIIIFSASQDFDGVQRVVKQHLKPKN